MKTYFRFLYWLLKVAAPVNVVLFPAIALYGAFVSWGPSEEALRNYGAETAVMVGAGAGSQYSISGGREEKYKSKERTYLLFPSVLRDPKLVTIQETNHNTLQVTESKGGFFFLVAWYLLCIVGMWWFWLRRKPIEQENASPNI
jgi:hypothetical protein